MAYTLVTNNNNLYEIYIGQDNNVILANTASQLFQNYNKSTTLDVSNLDTSKVTTMSGMFNGSKATFLNLSSFNTSLVEDMSDMFYSCSAKTGYARTQTDANRFNASSRIPSGLKFVVKS